MKALSLLDPWASLVMLLQKGIETRSRYTNYRGPLAIHASKGRAPWHMNLAWEEPFFSALSPLHRKHENGKAGIQYHLGCVIATGILVDCLYVGISYLSEYKDGRIIPGTQIPLPTGNELAFGDYSPGRFAWILKDVRQLPEPVPAKGKLGLWEWEGVA